MLTGDLDLGDVDRLFDGMERRAGDADRFLATQRGPVLRDHRQYASQRKGPDGTAWAPLAPSTRKKRRKRKRGTKSGKPLGKLPKLLRGKVRGGELVVDLPSTVAHIGKVHQSGGAVGRGARVPARPFVGLTEERAAEIAEDYAAFVASGEVRGR